MPTPTLNENIAWMVGFLDGLSMASAKVNDQFDHVAWNSAFGMWKPASGEFPPKISNFITRKDGHGDQQ